MEELVIIGKRTVYMRCLKVFLLKEVYKNGHILYFESIRNFLNVKYKMNNTVVFIFEDTFDLKDFIQLCVLYGSDNVKLVTHNREHIWENAIKKKYRIEDFIISIEYNQKDCFIETLVSLNNKRRTTILKLEEIYYVERYYGRIYFYTRQYCYDERIISANKYDSILNDFYFIKIRKGCYVNRKHIRDIKNNIIILNNNVILFFSKNMHQKCVQFN